MTQKRRGTSLTPKPGKTLIAANNVPLKKGTSDNQIRNWRLFRGIETQSELAELTRLADPDGVGLTRATVCRLESSEKRYHEDHIRLLSMVLKVAPRDLIGTDPYAAGDIFVLYSRLSKRDQAKLTAFASKLDGTSIA